MAIIMIIMASALGAFLYRWRGGPAWLPAPRWLKLALCASLLAAGAFWHATATLEPWRVGTALAGFLAAFGGLSLGHGSYMDLAHNEPGEESWLAWALRPLLGLPRYWYEFLALALTGLAATLGPGIALALTGDALGGIVLALAGLLKAPAYAVGWLVAKGSRATETGEWLTGAAWGAVAGMVLGA